ncbi:MAG: hypothetical protein O7F16_05395 [Acidobacteria bacterium]|nr:hypothetical protein [Acidobacteriota bacterium]
MTERDPKIQKVLEPPHADGPVLERLRTRGYSVLDALMTTPGRDDRRLRTILRALLLPGSRGYRRVSACLQLVDRMFPGAARRTTSLLCRTRGLPFEAEQLQPIGFGSGGTVFRFESRGVSHVLKIYRRTMGRSVEALAAAADYYRARYELARAWYLECDVVHPTHYLILPSPLLGLRAIGACQTYLPGPLLDLFETPLAVIIEKSAEHPGLAEQIVAFARRTAELRTEYQAGVDLIGRENLNVIQENGSCRLRLIDFGYIDLAPGASVPEHRRHRDQARAEHLSRLVEALTS